MTEPLDKLERRLGHRFSNKALVERALSHRSSGSRNNERLEFLGDSLLNCVIAEALFHKFDEAQEGQLSRLRARLVKGETLAKIAREMEVGDFLRLGVGELRSGGFRRASILADTLEALIGAIYLDAGIDVCRARVLDWFDARLNALSLDDVLKDPKTRLQEYLQGQGMPLPEYRLDETRGESHAQTFYISCRMNGIDKPTHGQGTSRRAAEQQAAREALVRLGQEEAK